MLQVELYRCCVLNTPNSNLSESEDIMLNHDFGKRERVEKILVNVSDIKHTQLSHVIFCSYMYIRIKIKLYLQFMYVYVHILYAIGQ